MRGSPGRAPCVPLVPGSSPGQPTMLAPTAMNPKPPGRNAQQSASGGAQAEAQQHGGYLSVRPLIGKLMGPVWSVCTGTIVSPKKEGPPDACSSMERPWGGAHGGVLRDISPPVTEGQGRRDSAYRRSLG